MPKIQLKVPTSLKAQDSFDRVQKLLSADPDLLKLDSGLKCEFDSQKLTGSAKGSKFSAIMSIEDKAGTSSVINLTVELPLMLTPFKGMVEKTLNDKLNKILKA